MEPDRAGARQSLVVNFPAKKTIKPEDSDLGGNNLDRLASGHPTYTGSSSVGTYPSLDLSMQSHQRHSQADHAYGTSSIATQEKKISWPEGANPGRDNFDDLATVASSSPIATRPTRKPAAANNTPFSVARQDPGTTGQERGAYCRTFVKGSGDGGQTKSDGRQYHDNSSGHHSVLLDEHRGCSTRTRGIDTAAPLSRVPGAEEGSRWAMRAGTVVKPSWVAVSTMIIHQAITVVAVSTMTIHQAITVVAVSTMLIHQAITNGVR